MGWKWEVEAWSRALDQYSWVQVHTGQSLVRALLAMRKAKKTAGAVRLTWR